jgi:hypothetical protein
MRKHFILLSICILFITFGYAQNSKIDQPASKTYAVGNSGPSGVGIVFYVTDGGLHGLEAAPVGWNGMEDPASVWIEGAGNQNTLNGNTLNAIGTGLENSYAIIIQASLGNSAARICRNYIGGGKTDWFLPSKAEIIKLYDLAVSGIYVITSDKYWSSSEIDANNAWVMDFTHDTQITVLKSTACKVHAIRAF